MAYAGPQEGFLRARGWINSFCVCAASAQQKRAQSGGVQRFAITNAHEASICLLHALMYSFCHIQKQRTKRALSCLSSVLHASRRKRLKCSAGSWSPKGKGTVSVTLKAARRAIMAAPPGLHGAVLGNPVSNLVAAHLLPGNDAARPPTPPSAASLPPPPYTPPPSMPPSPSPLPPASQPPAQSP